LTESTDSDNDGTVDTTTTYGYTATEQTSKTVVDEATSNTTSQTDYEYGLDGRMQKVTIQTYDGTGTLIRKEVTTYDYDPTGNSSTDSLTLTVIDPTDVNDPVVSFSSPADEAEVTSPTDVVGSVTDPDSNLVSWTLTLDGLSADDLVIGSGTAEVTSGVLGSIDPTILANGVYELELSAVDAGGNTASVTQNVTITGELKLGNFSLSFVDLQIPVAGFPITVSRTYNTLLAGRQEDFGYGWTLDIDNTAVDVTHDYAASEELSGFGSYIPFRDGTRVVVTMPDGSTEGFTFQGVPGTQFGSIIVYWLPTFVPDPGVTSELITSSTPLSKVGEEYVGYTNGLWSRRLQVRILAGTFAHHQTKTSAVAQRIRLLQRLTLFRAAPTAVWY
jgi:hypothetical protein